MRELTTALAMRDNNSDKLRRVGRAYETVFAMNPEWTCCSKSSDIVQASLLWLLTQPGHGDGDGEVTVRLGS